jgi:hypothetical protein
MASLKDLINLIGQDGSKAYVLDETGEIKLVVLSVDEYQRVLRGKLRQQVEDIEAVNKQIVQAQLEDDSRAPQALSATSNLPAALGGVKPARSAVDLRSEVIDPNFDFNTSDDGEAVQTEFDDI